jgi:hypothetical protein
MRNALAHRPATGAFDRDRFGQVSAAEGHGHGTGSGKQTGTFSWRCRTAGDVRTVG